MNKKVQQINKKRMNPKKNLKGKIKKKIFLNNSQKKVHLDTAWDCKKEDTIKKHKI